MREKTIANSILGGFELYTSIVWVGKHVCQAFGWVEWAQGLNSAMTLIQTPLVNWDSIFGIAFCVFSVFLIVLNFDFLLTVGLIIQDRKPQWNAIDKNIIHYIAGSSIYGTTFNYENRFVMAAECFLQAIQSGKLKVSARKRGEVIQTFPKAKDFKNLEFMMRNSGPNSGYAIYAFSAVTKNDKKIVYESIVCDWRQVRKIWPPKSG